MQIICARLATGEEIIGKLITSPHLLTSANNSVDPFSGDAWDIPSGIVILEDVRIVAIQQVPGRGVGISFIPYSLANPEAKIKINLEKHAMSVYPPEQNLERAYIGEHSQIALATPETARQQGIKIPR
jgi:hypothetical protein